MEIVKKNNSIFKLISGILLIAVMMTAVCPIPAYAAADNPESSTLDIFPDPANPSDTMNENLGTINTFYNGGTIKDNKGRISFSYGTVNENHGFIDSVLAGHVGTNYGTINIINNTGSLGVNDDEGTVVVVGMGNEVSRNDGLIQTNAGNIEENYGTVGENHGRIIMHDGQVLKNIQNGTVSFETKIVGGETIPAKGTIENNQGDVKVHSGSVTIKENTGNIEISNATVNVEKNSGTITVGDNGTLICNENGSGGKITKTSASAAITCTSDEGLIYDATAVWYKIVFSGDDGTAEVLACDLEMDGFFYTQAQSNVIFSLPAEYECTSASIIESGNGNIWMLSADPTEGDTEFTISCQKRSICDLQGHKFNTYIANGNATCTKDGTKTAVCENGCGETDTIADIGSAKGHTFGEWVITKPATATEPGTKERICSVCKAKDTQRIPVLSPVTYSLISGANSEWTKGTLGGLVFVADTPFDKFDSVTIDGVGVATANYTAEPGSTRITLSSAYLETLDVGEHNVEIVFTDGSASAGFSIKAANPTGPANPTDPANPTGPVGPLNPGTGDNSRIFLWITILFVSSGALIGTIHNGKKRKTDIPE